MLLISSGYLTGAPSAMVEFKVENVADKLKQYS
jgi:hypothetical protein